MPKMMCHLTISLALAFFAEVPSSHAANKPHARSGEKRTIVWTNEDLEKLRGPGLVSVVGQVPQEAAAGAAAPLPYVTTQDPEWYAEQASKLQAELKYREAKLEHYRQALEDVRSLKTMTGGTNLDRGVICITPDGCMEILQRRVQDVQSELEALEALARRNGIPPGTLRGQ